METAPKATLRKLAAIDIVFLGYRVIVAEYACGVFLSAALGVFVLFRAHSFWQFVLGAYLVGLGINYVPMLVCALRIGGVEHARAELGDELVDRRAGMSRYRKLSLVLLVPGAAVLLASIQAKPIESKTSS
jgi:hypothetical protein